MLVATWASGFEVAPTFATTKFQFLTLEAKKNTRNSHSGLRLYNILLSSKGAKGLTDYKSSLAQKSSNSEI